MDPVKVPQNLELQDIVAWGMGAADLLCVVTALTVGWWLYLALPGPEIARAVAVGPVVLMGVACAVAHIGDVPLRDWLVVALAYALRPRVLVTT